MNASDLIKTLKTPCEEGAVHVCGIQWGAIGRVVRYRASSAEPWPTSPAAATDGSFQPASAGRNTPLACSFAHAGVSPWNGCGAG
jgi:hypothetical protein